MNPTTTFLSRDRLDLSLPPPLGRGGVSTARRAEHDAALATWCERLLKLKPRIEFDPGVRGWCYVMEEYGLSKGDFDRAEDLVSECRKRGLLPLDFTGDEVGREFIHIEELDEADPEDEARRVAAYVETAHESYEPLSLWEFQENYVEMLVEKVGLRNLFEPVCERYHVALGNTRGSWSINMRVNMLRRFAKWQVEGKQCVLLYCGDHDIHGLRISTALRKNLEDVLRAFRRTYPEWKDFDLDAVVIERFGLNADFIQKHRLSWSDNLITGGGKDLADPEHGHHWHRDVQQYIRRFGKRKVEADALVTRPRAGRAMCQSAVLRYVTEYGIEEFERRVEVEREEMREALDRMLGR
jgi:hypothetical protein